MEEKVYCPECGKDENLAYITTYANGDFWECKDCDKEFEFTVEQI